MTETPRRRFLKGAGLALGGGLVLGSGGIALRGWQRGAFQPLYEGAAFAPWDTWAERRAEGPLVPISAAILASSPHNTQPWRFVVGDGRIDLHAVPDRNLGAADPFRREQRLGLGCALENLLVAAPGAGFAATPSVYPEGADTTLVTRIELNDTAPAPHALEGAIVERHTDRAPYKLDAPLPRAALQRWRDLNDHPDVGLSLFAAESEPGRRFAETTISATEALVADETFMADSHEWWRQTPDEIESHRDGVTVVGGGMPPMLIRIAIMLPDFSAEQFGASWIDQTRDQHCGTAAHYGLITVRERGDPAQLIAAGRLWQRLHLAATTDGLAMQPLNQAMELADRDRQLERASPTGETLASLAADDGDVVFGFRTGQPTRAAHRSPRRALAEVVSRA